MLSYKSCNHHKVCAFPWYLSSLPTTLLLQTSLVSLSKSRKKKDMIKNFNGTIKI